MPFYAMLVDASTRLPVVFKSSSLQSPTWRTASSKPPAHTTWVAVRPCMAWAGGSDDRGRIMECKNAPNGSKWECLFKHQKWLFLLWFKSDKWWYLLRRIFASLRGYLSNIEATVSVRLVHIVYVLIVNVVKVTKVVNATGIEGMENVSVHWTRRRCSVPPPSYECDPAPGQAMKWQPGWIFGERMWKEKVKKILATKWGQMIRKMRWMIQLSNWISWNPTCKSFRHPMSHFQVWLSDPRLRSKVWRSWVQIVKTSLIRLCHKYDEHWWTMVDRDF